MKRKMNKKAATEWTVGKLVAIILLILVIVLVTYGVATGGFNPLIVKVKGMFNGVLSYFGKTPGGVVIKPRDVSITGVGTGKIYLSQNYCQLVLDNNKGQYIIVYSADGQKFYSYETVYNITYQVAYVDKYLYFRYDFVNNRWEGKNDKPSNIGFDSGWIPAEKFSGVAEVAPEARTELSIKLDALYGKNLEEGKKVLSGASTGIDWVLISDSDIVAGNLYDKIKKFMTEVGYCE